MSKGLLMKYFVLNPSKNDRYGEASRAAMTAYAKSIDSENPELAIDLEEWVLREKQRINSPPTKE